MQRENRHAYWHKKVLITGAGGFVGSHLVEHLRENAELTALVRSREEAERLKDMSGFDVVEMDLRDAEGVRALVQSVRPNVVFNVASSTDTTRDFSHLDEILENTYTIAHNVLAASIDSDVERFIQFGSIEEYGYASVPFVETAREEPFSPYSLGKVMATQEVMASGRAGKIVARVVRPAAAFGPRQRNMLISNLIRSALAGKDFDMNVGEQLRDLIFVDDLVEGVLAVGAYENPEPHIFNLGSGRGWLVKDIATMVNKALGNPITINFGAEPYRPLDFMEFYMDSSKAKNALGWEVKTNLEERIEQTTSWYRGQKNTVF